MGRARSRPIVAARFGGERREQLVGLEPAESGVRRNREIRRLTQSWRDLVVASAPREALGQRGWALLHAPVGGGARALSLPALPSKRGGCAPDIGAAPAPRAHETRDRRHHGDDCELSARTRVRKIRDRGCVERVPTSQPLSSGDHESRRENGKSFVRGQFVFQRYRPDAT